MKRMCLTVFAVLLLVGCSVNKEYAERNKAAADLLLPDLRKVYGGEELKLDADQKKRRLILLDEWEKSIKAAWEATK